MATVLTTNAIQQSGTVTPGHVATWSTDGVIQDGGVPVLGTLVGGIIVAGGVDVSNTFAIPTGSATPRTLADIAAGPSAAIIPQSFSGNSVLTGVNGSVTAASATEFEFSALYQMNSSFGAGAGAWGLNAAKLTLGAVCTINPGSASGWAINAVTTLTAGAASVYGIGAEIDLNVNNAAYSSNGAPYAANLFLTGTTASASTYATAATIVAYGGGVNPMWNYGHLVVDYGTARAIKTAAFSDQSRSPVVLHSNTAHTNGIDFSGATFSGGSVIIGPNNTNVSFLTSGGTPTSILGINASNQVVLGSTTTPTISVQGNLVPVTDATYQVGTTTAKLISVHSLLDVYYARTAPGTPPAGSFYVYMDSADNKLKAKGPSGTVTILAVP